jgi:2-keto-4-pentenoate hydratase
LRGRKVGLTSRPMQQLLGVGEPDFGALLDDMFVEEGDPVTLDQLIQPKVEAEIAFVLREPLAGPGATTAGALHAIEGAMPAIEVIDSRVEGWQIDLVDTIADNASCGRVVLGGRLTPMAGFDLRLIGMVLSRNGEVAATGAGAAVLGNPARCVVWLANKLATFGTRLEAGDVVLAGALHPALPVTAGDVVVAEFDRLGSVTATFRGGEQ